MCKLPTLVREKAKIIFEVLKNLRAKATGRVRVLDKLRGLINRELKDVKPE